MNTNDAYKLGVARALQDAGMEKIAAGLGPSLGLLAAGPSAGYVLGRSMADDDPVRGGNIGALTGLGASLGLLGGIRGRKEISRILHELGAVGGPTRELPYPGAGTAMLGLGGLGALGGAAAGLKLNPE